MLLSLDQSISVQLYALNFLPVIAGFFHCPGKNTFCHGKNPTLFIAVLPTSPQGIKLDKFFLGNASQNYGVSPVIWDRTVLPDISKHTLP